MHPFSEHGQAEHDDSSPEVEKHYRVPVYDRNNQVVDHTSDFPDEWEAQRTTPDIQNDPEKFTILVEYSKATREIDQLRELGSSITKITGGEGLRWAMTTIDPVVGAAFQAHGIKKGVPYLSLDRLLREGIQSDRLLYTTEFRNAEEMGAAIGADRPQVEGGILVVSECRKPLAESGIRYVVLGEEYNRVVDLMRQKYPGIQITPWNEAPAVLTRAYNETTGEQRPIPELTSANQPSYKPQAESRFKNQGRETPVPGASETTSGVEKDVW